MKRSTLLSLIILCSMLGAADAFYLAETALTNGTLLCNIDIIDGCNTVAKSPYAHLFGIPLGVYGVGFYVLFFILALIDTYRPHHRLDSVLAVLGAGGIVASLIFVGIQLILIKALCIYCLASALLSALLGICAGLLYFKTKPGLPAVISVEAPL